MIAKFHSAPGHSMETTLTINIPAPDRRTAPKGDKLKVKEEELGPEEDEKLKKDDREQKEREKLERERRVPVEKGVSHKDKFQKMKERYEKVTTMHSGGIHELDALNAKIKKLQTENDLLLDAIFLADTSLYDRYFPPGPESGPPPIGHPPALVPAVPVPHLPPSNRHGHRQDYHPAPSLTSSSSSSRSRPIDQALPLHSSRSSQPQTSDHFGGPLRQPKENASNSKPHPYYVYPPKEPLVEQAAYEESLAHPRGRRVPHSQHVYIGTSGQHAHPGHHPLPPPSHILRSTSYDIELSHRLQDLLDRRGRLSREEDRELRDLLALNPPVPLLSPGAHGTPSRHSQGHPMPPPMNGYPRGREALPPPPHDSHVARHSRSSHSSRSSSRHAMRAELDFGIDSDMSLGGPVHIDVKFDPRSEGLHRMEATDTGRTPILVHNQTRGGQIPYPPPPPRPMAALEHPDDRMPPPSNGYHNQSARHRSSRERAGANGSGAEFDEGDGRSYSRGPRTSELDIVMSEDEGSYLGGPSGSSIREERLRGGRGVGEHRRSGSGYEGDQIR